MARSHESFNRRERERAKKQKAADKRERRLTKSETSEEDDAPSPGADPEVDQAEIIRQLAELNAAFEGHDLSFEDFEKQRAALLAQLAVD